MGTCSSQRLILQQSTRDLIKDGPKLSFNLQIWPKNKQVNFRDQEASIRQFFEISIQDGEIQNFKLIDNHIGIKIPSEMNHKGLKNIGCQVVRKSKVFHINFKNNQVCRSAIEWLQLKEGKICLIGKTKYRLRKYIKSQNYHEEQIKSTQQLHFVSTKTLEEVEKKCRVCYSSQESHLNPLINPCQCKGSIGFIHLQCLSLWLFGNIDQNQILHLETRKSRCQICKTNITETDSYRYIIASVLSGRHSIAAPFAIFQGFLDDQQMKRNYMILSFANKRQFKIGRSHHADISDKADPFVSRINSIIAYRNNSIWIKDNHSKHGTSVLLTNKLALSSQNRKENLICGNMSIQITYQQI